MPALETAPASTVPTFMLTQTRVIRAPRARVYEAWTNPEIVKQWFGPVGLQCPSVEVDPRIGGAYRIEFAPRLEQVEQSEALGPFKHEETAAIHRFKSEHAQ